MRLGLAKTPRPPPDAWFLGRRALEMRITTVTIADFRQITASIPWSSTVVLFGPNDSGKTNILDAIEAGFTRDVPRVDVYRDPDPDWPDLRVEVELDGMEVTGSADQLLFFRWARADVERIEGADEALEPLRDILAGIPEDTGSYVAESRGQIAEFNTAYRGLLRESWIASARASPLWSEAEPDFLRVLDSCVSSRRFRVGLEVEWMAPELSCLPQDTRDAFFQLQALEPQAFDLLPFFSDGPEPFYVLCDGELSQLARTVRIDFSGGDFAGLYSEIERFVNRRLSRSAQRTGRLRQLSAFALEQMLTGDAWLEREGEWVRVRPAVEGVCVALGERSTELAPQLITRDYVIQVVAHAPNEWRRVGNRVSIRLQPHVGDTSFDLGVASTGVATWAGYAVAQAMREMDDETPGQRPPPAIFLIDEPERHLHPLAQEEVAQWVGGIARDGNEVVIATHAIPFLRLEPQVVEYVQVSRAPDRRTVVKAITADVLRAVEEAGPLLGLPPAALVQLARGWLFVEGEDDRRVLETLFGRELRQAGVIVLRFHGAGRAKATFESLELLSRLGLPLYVVLDNVRAAALAGGCLEDLSQEEHVVRQLVHAQRAGLDIRPIPFDYLDVICALPAQAVRATLRERGVDPDLFLSWDQLVDAFERARQMGGIKSFKGFVMSTLGLEGLAVTDFIASALEVWDGIVPDAHPLRRIVDSITASVTG